jgi:hypothetical protein
MDQITGEQLRQKAIEHKITKWTIEECSVCEYPIHYIFDTENVSYDGGCNCSDFETYRPKYQRSSWNDVAIYINMQTDPNKIKKIKEFWRL